MIRTPDEIKKGLECCGKGNSCRNHCPYDGRSAGIAKCTSNIARDALAYIQQLESANTELLTKVKQLETKCHQLERERDAAVADIPRACGYCKWFEINRGGNMTECHNPNGCRNISGINTGFEWRGVKEE